MLRATPVQGRAQRRAQGLGPNTAQCSHGESNQCSGSRLQASSQCCSHCARRMPQHGNVEVVRLFACPGPTCGAWRPCPGHQAIKLTPRAAAPKRHCISYSTQTMRWQPHTHSSPQQAARHTLFHYHIIPANCTLCHELLFYKQETDITGFDAKALPRLPTLPCTLSLIPSLLRVRQTHVATKPCITTQTRRLTA